MWDWIINPFTTLLTLLYSVAGNNIVLAIVLFTVLSRVAMLPFTIQQQRTTRAQQALQPRIQKLQEKYKNDREKLAQEQMALMREAGVNPLGGCVTALIQWPIFLGLYQAILFALAATPMQLLDLSGRLWLPNLDRLVPLNNIVWGMDLSQPPGANPIYAFALPVLVVVSTWAQFKLTMPAAPKPKEGQPPDQTAAITQSMSTVMPLMFGFFALSFSVGISIYFITSNLIGMLQSYLINRFYPNKPVPAETATVTVEEAARPNRRELPSGNVVAARPKPNNNGSSKAKRSGAKSAPGQRTTAKNAKRA